MAGRLIRAASFVLLATLLASARLAMAQSSPDPTRPAVDDKAAAVTDGVGTTMPASSGLQSIIRRRGAKPAAIINGDYVELGGRVGDSKLSAINEDSVELLGPFGKEVLALTPGIQKQQLRPKPAQGPVKPRKKSHHPARKE